MMCLTLLLLLLASLEAQRERGKPIPHWFTYAHINIPTPLLKGYSHLCQSRLF